MVGATGCGKSTFIRKSLKQTGVQHGGNFDVKLRDGDGIRSIKCGYCKSMSSCVKLNSIYHLVVERQSYVSALFDDPVTKERVEKNFAVTFLEIDTHSLLDAGGNLNGKGWPVCLPLVDGIFVCYDASDRNSFAHVGELLCSHYFRPSLCYTH